MKAKTFLILHTVIQVIVFILILDSKLLPFYAGLFLIHYIVTLWADYYTKELEKYVNNLGEKHD